MLAGYAKRYHAGAFATPIAKDLAARPQDCICWKDSRGKSVLAITNRLKTSSVRTDFTGTKVSVPKGSWIVTHLAREDGAELPEDLIGYDYLHTYLEDHELTKQLQTAGWLKRSLRVSAASEMIQQWSKEGVPVREYSEADKRTFAKLEAPELPIGEIHEELKAVDQWHDDFPFYSDGTWSAVSLRGYDPADPRSGVKPSEMPKKWQKENQHKMNAVCDWTVLAPKLPSIRRWVESVDWWKAGLERIRLFRMAAKPGRDGHLGRHSDIQDKATGTRDGQLVRFHVPLVTHPEITMKCWTLEGREIEAHLEQGGVYYLDTRKPHSVDNRSPVDRVHLVCDVVVDAEIRKRLAQATDIQATDIAV